MATPVPVVRVQEAEYAGCAPPAAQVRRPPLAPIPAPFPLVRTLPETERPQEAAYIAPGTYTGSIGWPGPGTFPPGPGPDDRLRLNLGDSLLSPSPVL